MTHFRSILYAVVIRAVVGQNETTTEETTTVAPCANGECPASYFDPVLMLSPNKDCYAHQDSIAITCSGNIGGPPTNQCSNGAWVLPASTCEVFTCGRPTLGVGLNVLPNKPTYDARETITYSCTQGYTLTGTSSASCDQQDSWNPSTIPVCIVTCEVPVITNGNLTSSGPFNDGDTAQIQCYDGYTLEAGSSATIMCTTSGVFDNTPTCFGSCDIWGVQNSDKSNADNFNHGTTYTINCNIGFSWMEYTSFTLTCNDGVIGGTVPSACYADCSSLPAPVDGSVTSGIQHGVTVVYSCDRGFELNGTESATCTNGTWSDASTPVCTGQAPEDSITLFCNSDIYIVEIPGILLGQTPNINSVVLGSSCSGSYYDGEYLYVNSSYTDCETTAEVEYSTEMVIYRNIVKGAGAGIVTTEEYFEISVACAFDQNALVSSNAIMQNTLIRDFQETGQYDVTFGVYTDAGFTMPVQDEVNTNSYIYLLAEVNEVSGLDVYPMRCYATPEEAVDYHVFLLLINEGCPSSPYVSNIRSDATSNPNLSFDVKVFRFSSVDTFSIFIHCNLEICPQGGCTLPGSCAKRRRRSTSVNFSKHVTVGPIRLQGDEDSGAASAGGWQFAGLTVYNVTVSALLLVAVGIIGLVVYRGRRNQQGAKRSGSI